MISQTKKDWADKVDAACTKLFTSAEDVSAHYLNVDWSTWEPADKNQEHTFLKSHVGNEGGYYTNRKESSDGFFERNPYQDEADRIGVPVIPALPEDQRAYDPNPVVAICGACGRKVHQVESYSCGKGNCPIQPRAR